LQFKTTYIRLLKLKKNKTNFLFKLFNPLRLNKTKQPDNSVLLKLAVAN